MSTANKLTYLNDTKGLLKQKINNLGGDITDSTTFRQYAEQLQNVYDNLPKTSYAEGSNITLSNTLKGKLDYENDIVGYGQTSQEGTPTPETPIEIEVVRGTQEVKVENKNLFNDTLRQGVTNYTNGVYNANNTTRITTTNWLTLPKGTYTISAKNSASKTLLISNITFDTNGNFYEISGTTGQWKNMPFTITLPQDTKWQCNIGYSDVSNITPSEVSEFQIEKGSTATDYEPYQEPKTYQLSLGEYEFARIGNHVDTIEYDVDEDKVYKNENVGKYELPQIVEAIRTGTILDTPNTYYTIIRSLQNIIDIVPVTEISYNWYCNKLHRANGTVSDYGAYIVTGAGNTNMIIIVNSNDTLESLNTKLNNNIFYYQKATTTKQEITTILADQIKALYNSQSFTGTTIIEIDGDLPLIIKVRALKGE